VRPERVVQTPISENGFVGVVVGAAMTGMRPVAEIVFLDFLTLATDQKPVRVGERDVPIPSSGPLEQRVIPQLADIIEGCLESLQPV
jgi:pyruvate/2-oxoglutarate/acetoin dehydrogenase E1 component